MAAAPAIDFSIEFISPSEPLLFLLVAFLPSNLIYSRLPLISLHTYHYHNCYHQTYEENDQEDQPAQVKSRRRPGPGNAFPTYFNPRYR